MRGVKLILSLSTITFLLSTPAVAGQTLRNWKELKGDHFVIYYGKGDSEGDGARFARDVLRVSESYYRQISLDLGYQRYSKFWQWENRVKIYIYTTRDEYLKATLQPKWSHGIADYTKKEISSYYWSEEFLQSILPHEITHLIFRDYVGFKGEIPLWLDEGVAQWEEPAKRAVVRQVMKSVLEKGKALTIEQLMAFTLGGKEEDEEAVTNFYIQAVSVIDFLIREYGSQNFIHFCRQLRDGKSLNEALKFTYPTSIRDLNQLEEKWKKYILSTLA